MVGKYATNASDAMLLLNLIQVMESISGSVVPLAMFYTLNIWYGSMVLPWWHLLSNCPGLHLWHLILQLDCGTGEGQKGHSKTTMFHQCWMRIAHCTCMQLLIWDKKWKRTSKAQRWESWRQEEVPEMRTNSLSLLHPPLLNYMGSCFLSNVKKAPFKVLRSSLNSNASNLIMIGLCRWQRFNESLVTDEDGDSG